MKNKIHFSSHSLVVFGIAIITFFAFVLRVYKLDAFPPQLNRDEAALAINANFIRLTGMDEWQQTFPLQFKSFGDYKLPGYIYLLSFFFTFSVNDFIVRLPSALAGVIIVLCFPFFLESVYPNRFNAISRLLGTFIIATSPFALFYSRMAWEANVALALFLIALTLLFHKARDLKHILGAWLVMALAILTYNSALLLLPTLIIPILLTGKESFKQKSLYAIFFSVLCLIGFAVLLQTASQKSGITFFHDGEVLSQFVTYRESFPTPLKSMLGNKLAYFTFLSIRHYFLTFGPGFLVQHGGTHPWHSILGRGHVFALVYALFLAGVISQLFSIFTIFHHFRVEKEWQVLNHLSELLPLYLLLISPLPAIFTTDAPHATRSLFTFVMVIVISLIGFFKVYSLLRQKKLHNVFLFCSILIICFEFMRYEYGYYVIWPPTFSPDLQIGLKQEIISLSTKQPHQPILIAGSPEYLYAYAVWYTHMSPEQFYSTVERSGPETTGLYSVTKVGDFSFVTWLSKRDDFSGRLLEWERDEHYWIEKERF